jgi:DNA-binding SARP family transcriptional activator/DNA-binding beta-propeller fold protein YncE
VRCGTAGTNPHLATWILEAGCPSRYRRGTNELDFRLLGPLEVAANGTFLPLGGAKQRAVLALLVLHANEVVSVDRLIDELWGDSPPESAANMLQGYVSHLRKALEPDRKRGEHELLVSRPPGYVLQIRPDQLDAERFSRLTGEARQLLEEGDAEAAAHRFRAALALWRGPALADLAYESFARADTERLEELRLAALEDRIDADLMVGRHVVLVAELRELVATHPLRERLRGQLMVALYRSGRQAEALEVYSQGRRALREELGIEPGPALSRLQQGILGHDRELRAVAGPRPPLDSRIPRRRALLAAAVVVAGAVVAAVAMLGHASSAKAVSVKDDSIAVIDPRSDRVVDDIAVGNYPGPLAADDKFVHVCNIGAATVTRIFVKTRKRWDTESFSRATDLLARDGHLWAANGGAPGHTPLGVSPGTVLDYGPGPTWRTIRVGPSTNGAEEQTTLAGDGGGYSIWAGNQDTRTVRQIDAALGTTLLTIHGLAPGGLATVGNSSAGDTVWASDPSRNVVARIDEHAKRIVRRIHVPDQPTRLAADDRSVWVITRGKRHAVWRIDPKTNKVVAHIPLHLLPWRVALGAGAVWVAGYRVVDPRSRSSTDATVIRIDPRTNRIVDQIRLGAARAVDGIIVSHGLVWVAVPPPQ